jgi:transcriptional antiterminator RfaH
MLDSKKNFDGTDEAKLCKELNTNWFVVYTKPRSEKKVLERLTAEGYEAYCPMQKVRKNWTDRKKWIEEPIFKSYCFVRADEHNLATVREVQGVVNFVYWLKKPALVRDHEIDTLKNMFSTYPIKAISQIVIKVGDAVKVRTGTFYNYRGVVKKIFKKTIILELPALKLKIALDKAMVEI